MSMYTQSLANTASWIIVRRSTGEPVLETYSHKTVQALNEEKYEAIPILKYLQEVNAGLRGPASYPLES